MTSRRNIVALLFILLLAVPASAQRPQKEKFEDAIDRALDYLQNEQNADGSWSGIGGLFGRGGSDPAVTSLCVMAFLSAGHVPGEGPYGSNIQKGVEYVLSCQQRNGLITGFNFGNFEMYQHGICTLMLAEAVGMLPDRRQAKKLRERLQLAVSIILQAQVKGASADKGGWRYRIQSVDADISVTGWQVMALRAAKNVGCDVPAQHIEDAIAYIKKCRDPVTGAYKYQRFGWLSLPCTGASVLSLALADKEYYKSEEARKAGSYILNANPNLHQHFFYGIYYTSQSMFQLGGNYWVAYRKKLHELLLQKVSPRNGSWQGPGGDDAQWGSHYCTAMAVLALTVEYRFLPIYQRNEEEERKEDGPKKE
jgi:hypothetical protein